MKVCKVGTYMLHDATRRYKVIYIKCMHDVVYRPYEPVLYIGTHTYIFFVFKQ